MYAVCVSMWTLSKGRRRSRRPMRRTSRRSKLLKICTTPLVILHLKDATLGRASGQWSWTHPSKPTNFVRDLPPCSYCALAKAKRSSFRGPITIPDQIGGLFFADVQGPFEVPSLDGSVYKIGIIEAKTRFIWMTMADSKKVDGMLEQWLKDTTWMRAQHGLKAFQFQTDNGEFASKKCRDLLQYKVEI